MEIKNPAKLIKFLLILQIIIIIATGICEVIQLPGITQFQKEVTDHPDDWNFLISYTSKLTTIVVKVYYWSVIVVSIVVLVWSLFSFERRWKNIQDYSDKSRNVSLLVLWCVAVMSNTLYLPKSNILELCSKPYSISQGLLLRCNSYLASLMLALMFIFITIIQIFTHFILLKHQKEIRMNQLKNAHRPNKIKVRRSKRVNKKKISPSSGNGSRLSIVTEDEEYKFEKSDKSDKSDSYSIKSDQVRSEFQFSNFSSSEIQFNEKV